MFSWGPICWVMIAEIFPNTIRGAAVAVAVAFQWVFNFIVSSTFLPMYNMRLGEMGDKFGHCFAYTLYGVVCVIAALFVWRLVPETKGKTLEESVRDAKEYLSGALGAMLDLGKGAGPMNHSFVFKD